MAHRAFCFAGPLLYHTNQVTVELNLAPPCRPAPGIPLGTDASGYDVLGRLMVGGQSSLELGFAVAIATTVVGTLYGAIAGLAGGIVDVVMMRVIDTLLAVPGLVLLLILVNIFTPNLVMIIAAAHGAVLAGAPPGWSGARCSRSAPGSTCRRPG